MTNMSIYMTKKGRECKCAEYEYEKICDSCVMYMRREICDMLNIWGEI